MRVSPGVTDQDIVYLHMASLAILPNELIAEVFEHASPGDLLSLAGVSRRFCTIGQRAVLRHKTHALVYDEVHDRYGHDIPAVLLRILHGDPSVAWYIRRLVIDRHRGVHEDWLQAQDDGDVANKDHDGLDGNLKPSGSYPFTRTDLKDWELLRRMYFSKMTQSVKDVTSHATFRDEDDIFIHGIRDLLRTAALGHKFLPRQSSLFANLRVVRLNHFTKKRHPWAQIWYSVADFAPFFTLPAIEELKVSVTDSNDDDPYIWEYAERSSHLKDWDAGSTEFADVELESLLKAPHSLRSFRPASWERFKLLHLLQKNSLEVLHLGWKRPEVLGLRELLRECRMLKDLPPYEWFHDGGAVNWEGNLRQQRRRLRKSLGLPASADVGIIAKLLSSLRAAAEEAQQRQITHAMIATPDLVALYDEDIADAAAHIGLALLSDSYYERQPKHVYAAFVAYGLNNHTLPSVPEKELRATGTRNVLTVYFSRGALGVEIASKWTNRTCLLTWAQHRSYFSTELGLPGFRLQGPWKKRVAALVQEAMYHELFQHHLDTGVTDVLLLGETADEEMLGQTVQDAVMEVQEREPVMHRAGREAMAFVGSRGAAEMAWAVMNGPLARAASAEECDAEQRRKQDTGGIPYYPPAAKEQDVDDLPDVYCGGVW
ncbi:hypothetical protein MMC13_000146 [Lambiella insularis]|nr:hypothetical protein [Lambiella insularis]